MSTLIKKHTFYFLMALVVCLISVFVCERFVTLITKRFDRITEAKNTLAAYDQNKKIFADESKKLATLAERASTLEKYRITKASIPTLLSNIEKLGAKYNLNFTITSVATPVDPTTAKEKLAIDFSAKGSPQAIEAFLAALSLQSYEVNYTNFSLLASDATPVVPTDLTIPTPTPGATPWQVNASVIILSY